MLQHGDAKTIFLCDGQQAKDFVPAITMAMNPDHSVVNGRKGFQPKVAPNGARVFSRGFVAVEGFKFLFLLPGRIERTAQDALDAGARIGKTGAAVSTIAV